jgi:hypothetical protein
MTTEAERKALRSMMESFVRGDDRSLNFVNQIERRLNESFRNDPIYEELADAVARYSPGGGRSLVDEAGLARQFRYVFDHFLKEDS